jgi:hypothetical protein
MLSQSGELTTIYSVDFDIARRPVSDRETR